MRDMKVRKRGITAANALAMETVSGLGTSLGFRLV